jgi:hypothetical protein
MQADVPRTPTPKISRMRLCATSSKHFKGNPNGKLEPRS